MFDVSIVSVKYPGVSRCVVSSAGRHCRRRRRATFSERSGVDPGARFQRDTIDNEAFADAVSARSAGVGMRVKSQPAAMKRRRSMLIRFPGKTQLPKYFAMG